MRHKVPIEFLHERLSLDASTGELRWKARPALGKAWNTRYAGKIAGTVVADEVVRVCLTYQGKKLLLRAHRVVFAMLHGRWPKNDLDHRNRTPTDNTPANLREATHAQNMQNLGLRIDNKSGFRGVAWHRKAGKWRGQVNVRGKTVFVGLFADLKAADRACVSARKTLLPFAQ